ncbi:MAG: tetratricopeptide repeat protein [Caulobacteraceae bacterium]
MAEGLLGGLLGGEEDGAEAEALGEARLGAEAFAATLAADHAKYDPRVARAAETFLEKQARLLDAQTEEFIEQRALRLSHLRNQSREGKIRRVGQRIRVGMQALVALIAGFVALSLVAAAWSAANDHGLVVEPFSVPPDLAQRGLTGQVVAKQVLDRLSDLQAQTTSMRAANSYQNNWGEDLKVEIPETGVSLGEVRRYLREWLGHETHISGEIYRTPTGLTLTARAGEDAGQSFTAPDADYDKLVAQASEAVYRRTQPYRYASFLQSHGHTPEANAIYEELTHSHDPMERAWAYVGLAFYNLSVGNFAEAIRNDRLALGQVADFAPALSDLAASLSWFQHDQEAFEAFNALARDQRSIDATIAAGGYREDQIPSAIETACEIKGDYQCGFEAVKRVGADQPAMARANALRNDASLDIDVHDVEAARAEALRFSGDNAQAYKALALARAALDAGDPSSVALFAQLNAVAGAMWNPGAATRVVGPYLAQAKLRFGDLAGAQALAAALPADCYVCARVRGMVAARSGDRIGANRWFAEAIRQAPDLPQAYADRGQARLDAGDSGGALADAKRASQLSPHYPEALKLWGDALAREGDWKAALAKYDEALQLAPKWADLQRARDSARRKS